MQEVRDSRKMPFFVVLGLAWGGLTTTLITLINWYSERHLESWGRIVGRFVLFAILGLVWGRLNWEKRKSLARRKSSRIQLVLRGAVFVALMIGLVYVVWLMRQR